MQLNKTDIKSRFHESPVDIFWFSGSGNSLCIALEIRDSLVKYGCKASLFPLEKSKPADIDISSIVGFVVPVAGQGTHPFIWEFIEQMPETKDALCFFVDTLGMYSGGIIGPVKRIIKKKGYIPVAAKEILMPNIFQKMKSKPEKEKLMIERGRKAAREFCERMINGNGIWIDIPIYSRLMRLFYRYRSLVAFYKKLFPYSIDPDKCNRCGVCIALCPEHSLSMDKKGDVPVNNGNCSLCQRCFEFCPTQAIRIGNANTVVYRAVSLKELTAWLKAESLKASVRIE